MTVKTTTRRSFTDEFKQEAVSLLASSGRPLTQVATERRGAGQQDGPNRIELGRRLGVTQTAAWRIKHR